MMTTWHKNSLHRWLVVWTMTVWLLLLVWTGSTTNHLYFVRAISLTVDNFVQETEDKSVFLKFYAPWCGHCRAMAEDWKQLEEEWKNHPHGLVAEVDCTTEDGKPLCEDYQVESFPTLMYGDPLAAEPYEGPRDYESLAAHAKAYISKPICSVHRMEACDEEETKVIESLQAKSEEELENIVQTVSDLVKVEESDFDTKVIQIQAQYDEAVKKYNEKLDDIKSKFHFKYVEQIMTTRMLDEMGGGGGGGGAETEEDGAAAAAAAAEDGQEL